MKNLFTGMLSFAYPLLEDMEIGMGGESLAPFYEIADQELSCFLFHPDISDPDREARFLLLADYITSVPFGRTGYEEACRIAGKMGLDFPNLRYEKTAFLLSLAYKKPDPETAAYWAQEFGFDVLEECTIPNEDMEKIRGYFNKANHGKFDPHCLADLARAFAIFGHELEARFGLPGLKNMGEVEKTFVAFTVALEETFEEHAAQNRRGQGEGKGRGPLHTRSLAAGRSEVSGLRCRRGENRPSGSSFPHGRASLFPLALLSRFPSVFVAVALL